MLFREQEFDLREMCEYILSQLYNMILVKQMSLRETSE